MTEVTEGEQDEGGMERVTVCCPQPLPPRPPPRPTRKPPPLPSPPAATPARHLPPCPTPRPGPTAPGPAPAGSASGGGGKTYAQMQCPDWEQDPDRKKRAQKAEKPRAARKSPRTKRTAKQRTDRQLSGSTRVATMQEIDKEGPPGGVKDDEGPGMGWT